uniref:Uncharacterized protein n=1 Tax=Romanomermis culicivorax TaxID=13658 RepID=A0A915I4G9_ROMCU
MLLVTWNMILRSGQDLFKNVVASIFDGVTVIVRNFFPQKTTFKEKNMDRAGLKKYGYLIDTIQETSVIQRRIA